MKRRILIEQLQELTNEQKQKLRELWKPDEGDYYMLTLEGLKRPKDMIRDLGGWKDELDIYKNDKLPLLDIGQMIELLESKIGYFSITNMFAGTDTKKGFCYGIYKPNTFDIRANNLCDALWQAVKTVLADKKEMIK